MRNQHQHLHEAHKRDYTTINGQVISVVYVTASPTFTGVIGGYATSGDNSTPTTVASSPVNSANAVSTVPTATPTTATSSRDPFSYDLSSLQAQASSIAIAGSTAASSDSDSDSADGSPSSSISYTYGAAASSSPASSTATSAGSDSSNLSTTSSDSSNSGMSTAGKAGLAVGIMLAIGAVLALLLFLLSKKKRQVKADQARQDSEKNAAIAAAKAQPAAAPRLSLRPASSFLPEFMGGARPKSRLSQGNGLGIASNEPNPLKEKYLAAPAPQNIPMTQKSSPAENPFKDPENPFADPVQPISHQSDPEPLRMPEPITKSAPLQMPVPMITPAPAQAPLPMLPQPIDHSTEKIAISAASAGALAAAQASRRHSELTALPQEPVEMPSAPVAMPAPTTTHRALDPNASAQAGSSDGQVFRILLDFNPSMEDELELKGGQIVRMLHEYDDGWCLCARLDRSQQGVVPRTCLAAKPSKPRPGPGSNQQRSMSPSMGPQSRSMSPAMRNGPPRSMSPSQNRPMSPGPQGRQPMGTQSRSMSPAQMGQQDRARSMSPGEYNQPPRPLSPGPRSSRQSRRAQSPGPYGSAGGPKPMAPSQRRRSNSSSAAAKEVRERRASPPGPSPLGGSGPGLAM